MKRKQNFLNDEFQPQNKKRKIDFIKEINKKEEDYKKSQCFQSIENLIKEKRIKQRALKDKINDLKNEIKSLKKKNNEEKYKFLEQILNKGVPLIFNNDPKIKETKTLKFSIELNGYATYYADPFQDPDEFEDFYVDDFCVRNASVVDILVPQLIKEHDKCCIDIQEYLSFCDFEKLFLFELDFDKYIRDYLDDGYYKHGELEYYVENCIIDDLYLVVKK